MKTHLKGGKTRVTKALCIWLVERVARIFKPITLSLLICVTFSFLSTNIKRSGSFKLMIVLLIQMEPTPPTKKKSRRMLLWFRKCFSSLKWFSIFFFQEVERALCLGSWAECGLLFQVWYIYPNVTWTFVELAILNIVLLSFLVVAVTKSFQYDCIFMLLMSLHNDPRTVSDWLFLGWKFPPALNKQSRISKNCVSGWEKLSRWKKKYLLWPLTSICLKVGSLHKISCNNLSGRLFFFHFLQERL